jgi:hypothetical protein
MSGEELVTLITALAIAIAKDKSDDELSQSATIFTQLGDTLATLALQKQLLSERSEANKDSDKYPCKSSSEDPCKNSDENSVIIPIE